ncbi:hypothetical protein H0H81_006958 [Sphagnurus paluster]|uniref:Uncharacterized protein n=1 Tax=Sphagnurus paluster TaxID=117069 RepID=A0A9P7GRL7_9AGAR|nr:hypothetical protein H0H81_006958 [Sphagnurus paluster]
MDQFKERLFINGWDRSKAVWTVPQAFGNETSRYPTGKEFVVQSILGINHGGLGVISWNDPTTSDIKSSASLLALSLPKMTPFILNPTTTFRQVVLHKVDVGMWTVGSQTLVLAGSTNNDPATIPWVDLGLSPRGTTQVLNSGAVVKADKMMLERMGSGGFILLN